MPVVAHFFISMPVGGAEDLALTLANQPALKEDYPFAFLCLRSLGALGEEAAADGRDIALLPAAASKRFSLPGLFKIVRWLKERRASVVHSHTFHAHTYAVPAARLAGVPVVLHQHKTLERMKWRRRWTLGHLMRSADAVIALSTQTAGSIIQDFAVRASKVHVLSNPVDRKNFFPAEDDRRAEAKASLGFDPGNFLVGSIGSLNPVKNHLATVAVAEALLSEQLPIEFAIFGEGPQRHELQEVIRTKQLSNRVKLMGAMRPIAPAFAAMDAFVLPSRWEGQSMAVLQALACEIPILASRIEGNATVLGDDHPGLFELDNVGTFRDLLRSLVADARRRDQILGAQQTIALPEAEDAARELASVYQSLQIPTES